MEYKVKAMEYLCALEMFTINGRAATADDFVTQDDHAPWDAEPYCCGDMRATRIAQTCEVLQKYGITREEYDTICGALERALSFGSCNLCS